MDRQNRYLKKELIDPDELSSTLEKVNNLLKPLGKKAAYDINGAYDPE